MPYVFTEQGIANGTYFLLIVGICSPISRIQCKKRILRGYIEGLYRRKSNQYCHVYY